MGESLCPRADSSIEPHSTLYNRALHVITEIDRTQRAQTAIENGDYAEFGRLMNASHDSLRFAPIMSGACA